MTWPESIWWRHEEPLAVRALLSPLLLAEAVFRSAVAGRGFLYDRGLRGVFRASVPVISVGNLVVGGAGKTPVVLAIAARLSARHKRVAIVSRGYGATRSHPRVASDGGANLLGPFEAGDEPALLARRLPGVRVLCGADRREMARRATSDLGADVVLLDDGFQHRALRRDLDVVVVDACNGRGNGHMLPRGPCREPVSALGRADLVWLSHADDAPPEELGRLRELARRTTGRRPIESRHAVTDVLDADLVRSFGPRALEGRRVLLFSGLARPDGFRRTLRSIGADVGGERVFRDHHRFSADEVEEALRSAAAVGCDSVAMTEKDAMRLPPAATGDGRLLVVRIESEILAGAERLEEALDDGLARRGRGLES